LSSTKLSSFQPKGREHCPDFFGLREIALAMLPTRRFGAGAAECGGGCVCGTCDTRWCHAGFSVKVVNGRVYWCSPELPHT
jgi:hypothetical protein